jgi:flagellar hook assembly protein FlgD
MFLRVYPNPGSRQTSIDFATRHAGSARANVYDVAGRRVRQLTDGMLGAGGHHLFWDGRDENGGAVAAGTYFIRVSTTEGCATTRFVMIR